MASLADCLKKSGKIVSKEDKSRLLQIRAQLIFGGQEPSVADGVAVDEYLNELESERTLVLDQLKESGADTSAFEREGPLTRSEISFDNNLSPELAVVQERFAQDVTSRPWSEVVAEYEAIDGTTGPENTEGGQINSADAWRELSPDYRNDRSLSSAVHEVSSALAKKYFNQKLREHQAEPYSEFVTWTAGGTGAGKTSSLRMAGTQERSKVVYDTNLSNRASAIRKIDQALASNRMVSINFTLRHPIDALQHGAVKRAIKQQKRWGTGRIVPLKVHVGTHVGSVEVIKQLHEHYANDPRVRFDIFDNRYGKGGAVPTTIAAVPDFDYNDLLEQGRQVLDDLHENGNPETGEKLSDELYNAFVGEDAQPGTDSAVQSERGSAEPIDDQVVEPSVLGGIAPPGSKVQPEQALYTRSPESGTGQSVKAAELRLALAPAIRSLVGSVQVNIAETTAELPGTAVPGDVEGMWNVGTDDVWLVAENLNTIDRAKRVMVHEVFGHLAMERQPEFQTVLSAVQNLKNMRNADVMQAVDQVAKTQGMLDSTTEAKEIVAVMAENGIKSGTITRAIASMRQMLRRLGLNLEFNEAEIRELIARAARDLTNNAAGKRAAIANMPVQAQIINDPRSVEQSINAALEDIYANNILHDYTTSLHADLNAISGAQEPSQTDRAQQLRQFLYRSTVAGQETSDEEISADALYSRAVSADPEIERLITTKMSTPLEDISPRDRVRNVVEKLKGRNWLEVKQGMIDSAASIQALEENTFGGLLDASESAYKAVLATKNLSSVMAAVMHGGVPVLRDGVFSPRADRQGLIEIFEPITQHKDGNLLAQWELYAAAKRSNRLIKEKNEDGSSREKLFTQDEINKALELETQYPEFKVAFLSWQKFNSQLLDLAIKQGVINGEEAKIWRQNDYVPFYRAMEEVEYSPGQGPKTGRDGVANVRSGIRRLTGSETPLGNVFENMVMNTSYLIDATFKNTAMQRVVAMAEGVSMEQIPMAWEAIEIQDGDMAKALMKAGLIVGQGSTESDMLNDGIRQVRAMSQEQKEHWSKVFRRVAPKGDDVVSVLIDGKPVYYRVDDPLLLRSIGAMGAQQYGGVMNLFRLAKRTLTGAVTIDPAFMMANFIRDTLSTWVVADNGAAPPFLKALKGAASAWKQDPDTMQLMMAGAGGGGFYDHNPAEVRKMLAKKMPKGQVNSFTNSVLTPRGLWRFWQKVGNASEQANRVAKYRQVIANGGTVAEAAYQARDVLNFTMSGDYEAMKWIVQTVPFLNARVQGLYRLARGGAEHPASFTMKGLMIMAATMALLLKNRDEEEYQQLPEWDKDTYWHFFVGDQHFRMPKPFEIGALFATIPERAFLTASGDEGMDLFNERMIRMVSDTFAFNPIPQLVKPAIEQYANRNMFTGNPIVGLAQQGLAPEAQYDPWTSETMRGLASAMPDSAPEWLRSPKRLEAAVRGYFGAIGMYALGASDSVTRRAMGHPSPPKKAIQDYPVISRFWRNPEPRSSKYASELYDMLNEADQIHRTMNAFRDQGRIEEMQGMLGDNQGKLATRKFLRSIAEDVGKINKKIRQIQYSNMPPAEKKAAIDRLNNSKIRLLGQVASVSDLY